MLREFALRSRVPLLSSLAMVGTSWLATLPTERSPARSDMAQGPTAATKPEEETEEEEVVFGVTSYPANDPTEDRVDVQRLDVIGGWWFACFDGHGGWQAAEFAQKELHRNLEVELGNRIGLGHAENNMLGSNTPVGTAPGQGEFVGRIHDRLVSGAITAAFERTDRVYKSKVQGAFEVGFGRDTRAGSCALGALLVDGLLFVANLGDSRAVLGVNRDAYNALDKQQRQPTKFQNAIPGTSTLVTDSKASSENDADNGQQGPRDEPTFHVTEYLRRAAVMKAHGEKLNPEVEAKLREVLAREVQAQDVLITGREAAAQASTPSLPPASLTLANQPPPPPSNAPTAPSKEAPPPGTIRATIKNFLTGAPFLAVELTRDHNCRDKRERKKLEEEHPDETDVVVCRKPDACYIKGKLQPTRSFGDFYLKYSEFMRSPSQHSSAGKYISPPYTPPYISATPEISVTRLRPGVDDFLILATDGLWDFVSSQEAVSIAGAVLRGEGGDSRKAAKALEKVMLERAAEKAGMDVTELEKLNVGRERRRRHDDTTIIIVDLRRAFEFFWWG